MSWFRRKPRYLCGCVIGGRVRCGGRIPAHARGIITFHGSLPATATPARTMDEVKPDRARVALDQIRALHRSCSGLCGVCAALDDLDHGEVK